MTRARDLSNLIGSGNYVSETLTATAGQTAFTVTNGYTPNFVQVFMNGLLLDPVVDYAATTSPTITLTTGANAGDELEVVKYNTFSVGDAITQTAADARYVNASGDTMTGGLNVMGDLTVDGTGKVTFGSVNRYIQNPTGTELRIGADNSSGVITAYTNATERLRIDSAGRVTMPYQPAFMARNGAGFNTNGYLNSFINIDFNIGGHFNNSSGLFTAPISGRYLIMAGVLVEAGSGRLEFRLNYNGGYHILGNGTGTTFDGPTVSGIIQMSAGDYVRVDRVSGTAHGDGNHGNTYFGGYLLG